MSKRKYKRHHTNSLIRAERANELMEKLEAAEATIAAIQWKSICKDNMEYQATITCFQMGELQAILNRCKS